MKKTICLFLFLTISHLFIGTEEKFTDKQVYLSQTMGDFNAVIYIIHSMVQIFCYR